MNDIEQLTNDELRAQHKAIYDQFTPTVQQYQNMAAELLQIQIELFKRRLKEEFPTVPQVERARILDVNARVTMEKFEAVLTEVKQHHVAPVAIQFDPLTFNFTFFGKTK